MSHSLINKTKSISALATLAVALFILPTNSSATAIVAVGTVGPTVCAVGVCPQPDNTATAIGVSPASPSASGSFNFVYTFTNGDQFSVVGSYNNSYGANGSSLDFSPVITYIGNNGKAVPSAGIDVLALTMLQNFYDPEPSPWDTLPNDPACEHITAFVSPNSTLSGTLSFGTPAVPVGTIIEGPGYNSQTICAPLAFSAAQNASDYLDSSYNLTFTFGTSTPLGAVINTAVPEPATSSMLLFGVLSAATILFYFSKR